MDAVADRLLELFIAYGYLVVIAGVFLDNFGLPSSGDIVLFLAAGLAQGGELSLPLVIVLAFAAAVASDQALYWIGRLGARGLLARFLRWSWVAKGLAAGERYFARHGPRTILFARFLAAIRTEVTFAAGVSAMPYRGFVVYDIVGAAAWVAILATLGYFFGDRTEAVLGGYTAVGRVLPVAVALFVTAKTA